jgi:hypothetical protein
MIYCTLSGFICKCTIAEKSSSAGSYRGEIFGAILAQLILSAAVQGRMGPYPISTIDCDNLGVVRHGNMFRWPLATTQPQADVLKIMKRYIVTQPFTLKYLYVASHADDSEAWKDYTLKERINIKVEELAKKALRHAHDTQIFFDGQFPMEEFTVHIDGAKVTSPIKSAIEEYWGRSTTKNFFYKKNSVKQGL